MADHAPRQAGAKPTSSHPSDAVDVPPAAGCPNERHDGRRARRGTTISGSPDGPGTPPRQPPIGAAMHPLVTHRLADLHHMPHTPEHDT
jgi:hypothetical protein